MAGRRRGRWLAIGAVGTVMLLVAACGSNGSATVTTASGPSTTARSGGVTSPAVVTVATRGALGGILVDRAGMTLYRYTPDGSGTSVCTGGCAAAWPPLTVPSGTTTVSGGAGLPSGSLAIITRSDGTLQVAFHGEPLYTFAGDKLAGQTSGQGVEGTWFVVSPVHAGGTTTTSTPAAAATGGGGY